MILQHLFDSIEKNQISQQDRLSLLSLLIEKSPDYLDIYHRLIDYLKINIPELKDLHENSIFSTHLKIIAFTFYEFILHSIRDLEKNIFIETANEEYLLRYANEFGLTRKYSNHFKAEIFVGSIEKPIQSITLEKGSIIHIQKTNQFFYTEQSVSIDSNTLRDDKGYYTIKVPVSSNHILDTFDLNTSYSIQYLGFNIAHSLSILENIKKIETLEDFRSRLLHTSQGLPPYSELAIQSKIENLNFIRYAYIDRKSEPGIVTIWVEFYPHIDLENKKMELHKYLDPQFNLAKLIIYPIEYEKISLSFLIQPTANLNKEQFFLEFRNQITNFFQYYNVKTPTLNLKVLFQYAYQNPEIQDIQFFNLLNTVLQNSFKKRYILDKLQIEWKI